MNLTFNPETNYSKWLKQKEKGYFEHLMKITGNNQSRVTRLSGLNRGTVRARLKLYGLI